jgi:hypothetical protein
MRATIPFLAAALLLTGASCNNGSTNSESNNADSASKANSSIVLADAPPSTDYPGAQLGIDAMQATPAGADSVKLSIKFGVKDFELKAQTPDADGKQCSNSGQGQHIHFILDNKPYVALYEPKHEVTVPKNTEHYLLCFLSRSYHESVKSPAAAVLAHFKIDEKGAIQRLDSPSTPMLFYSRPKGDYLAKDTANVLLDFYPTNAALGTAYKVKADITNATNGHKASFLINDWKPYFLQGLGAGKSTVVLSLVDKDGNPVSGPNTSISREINLAAGEPMP